MSLTEVVRDQIERLRVVLHLSVQACQVESVQDIVLVNLAKVFVALGAKKPVDPVFGIVGVRPTSIIFHY